MRATRSHLRKRRGDRGETEVDVLIERHKRLLSALFARRPSPRILSSLALSKICREISPHTAFPSCTGSLLAVDEINKAGGIMGRRRFRRPISIRKATNDALSRSSPFAFSTRTRWTTPRLAARTSWPRVKPSGLSSTNTTCPISIRTNMRPSATRWNFQPAQFPSRQFLDLDLLTWSRPSVRSPTSLPQTIILASFRPSGTARSSSSRMYQRHGGRRGIHPIGASQFAQTIQNIQKAKPDWLLTINVGDAQDRLLRTSRSHKLNLPMGSSIKIMLGFEHALKAAGAQQHAHAAANWFRGAEHASPLKISRSAGT